MSTWDSKHNFKLPRWGTTSADGPTDYVAEPPTQQQDDGWTPGVSKAVGEWWNWLHQQAYYWFRWAENIWSRRWPDPQVMRTAKAR